MVSNPTFNEAEVQAPSPRQQEEPSSPPLDYLSPIMPSAITPFRAQPPTTPVPPIRSLTGMYSAVFPQDTQAQPQQAPSTSQPKEKQNIEGLALEDIEYDPWAYDRQKEMLDMLNKQMKQMEQAIRKDKFASVAERNDFLANFKDVEDRRNATQEVFSIMSQKKPSQPQEPPAPPAQPAQPAPEYTNEQMRSMTQAGLMRLKKDVLKAFVEMKYPDLVGMNTQKAFYAKKIREWQGQ